MNDDDTQDNGEEAVGSLNDARLARLAEISGNADTAREGELVDITGDEDETERQAQRETEEAEAARVAAEEASPAEHPQKFKIKVNGNEIELTQDELIARASKVEAADQYLAHAKRMAEQSNQPSHADADEGVDDDLALARALQMGSEEEAAAVIAKIRKQTPSVDTDALATKAADRIRFEDASQWFESEYKDIMGDDKLRTLALEEDVKLVASGDKRSYKERYSAIGDDLRKWRGTSGTFEQKRALKSATVHKLPTAAARAAQPVEEEPDDSPTAVISQMARQRGQANI